MRPRRIMRTVTVVAMTLGVGTQVRGQGAEPRGAVTFPDATSVRVEIADTGAKRQLGLMFREQLSPSDGMIFVFEEPGYYPFWMKNTLIPLDMIWLDEDARVVSIAHAVPPCEADPCPSFPPDPGTSAIYVVEVVAGFARDHGVTRGDRLELHDVQAPGRP